MNNVTWDWGLFDALNFDGGKGLDAIMSAISGVWMWLPLYALIIYMVWRHYSWRGVIVLLVAIGVAMGMADIIAGIFKTSKGSMARLPSASATHVHRGTRQRTHRLDQAW